jgi:ribosomal protein S18 acetylase RimI-like enzyme
LNISYKSHQLHWSISQCKSTVIDFHYEQLCETLGKITMAQTSVPIPLLTHQYKQASEVMGEAFLNDPLWKYLVPDETRGARTVSLSMGILVRYSLLYSKIYTTPTLDGVACWLPPGETTPSFSRLIRIGVRSAPLHLGWNGFRRYMAVESYSGKIHKNNAPGKHWYLWGLGVKPSKQGQGIGGMLIQPVLAQADTAHLPCYLETMNEKNVPFYEKYGFKVMSDGVVPGQKLRVWAMLQEPG